ncbi:low density lipoprotein receptor adapter protein 1 isoform X2 [Mauremys mutica]|uniref:low density lipoprotein receptor adapter protein 1 isoform X2 n=1 Tax=Mauremys mutica TaxID=74926 RepID=UPI001D168D3A|nr:low density lipoprotein receptor adapter protein 1 isoform X2 [Mauremys mutica]
MEALRSAGRAIIRSPSAAKQSWGSGKHKKLPENWTDTRETLLEGMLFNLKYMGMTLVEQPKGEDLSAAAVKRIVAMAKASGKKLQKVTLKVSPRGIILNDSGTNELIENVSIYRISYCTADKSHDKVFAYIAQSQHNENLECHAFLCPKRKLAQAVTLTVAQAFKVAFEFWQASKEEKEKREKSISEGEGASGPNSEDPACLKAFATGNLLDFGDAARSPLPVSTNAAHVDELGPNFSSENNNVVWEMDDGLEEAFSRLSRRVIACSVLKLPWASDHTPRNGWITSRLSDIVPGILHVLDGCISEVMFVLTRVCKLLGNECCFINTTYGSSLAEQNLVQGEVTVMQQGQHKAGSSKYKRSVIFFL